MPYDSNLDESLFSKFFETETDRITVSVMSYNKGAKKLQITRQNKLENSDLRFTKLGRLTKDEADGVLPILQEAVAQMA